MFRIRFVTEAYAPARTVVMRWGPGESWDVDRGGVYTDGAWTFDLDEEKFPDGIDFKFVLAPGRWMQGGNQHLDAGQCVDTVDYEFDDGPDLFEVRQAAITERGAVAQKFFVRNLDPQHVYDVIVVGSGMGGGLLGAELAEKGADVLICEAGSYLFPTHVGNLPRRLQFGPFDKHIWSLWPDFKVTNYAPGSAFQGGQGFNLGGRSLFWGGLIPRQAPWELDSWPASVRDHLLNGGYDDAEAAVNRVAPAPSAYQNTSREFLQGALAPFAAEDVAMAVQYRGATPWAIPAGIFSTADLLMENRLVAGDAVKKPVVNLNVGVRTVDVDAADPRRVVGVTGWDALGQKVRSFRANTVVLAAGTLESPKIVLLSQLRDPNGLVGRGLTDHAIRFCHFALPPASPHNVKGESAKVILRHPAATATEHAFAIVVELGSDFNQGRYVNAGLLELESKVQQGWLLCEVVFMSYAALEDANAVTLTDGADGPVALAMNPVPPTGADVAESDALAATLFAAIGAQPLVDEPGLFLQTAPMGGVAHEVGTMRMAGDGSGVVDADLRVLDYDNLYVCDNSVFPTSPAANPSLTLAALALRLAGHLA